MIEFIRVFGVSFLGAMFIFLAPLIVTIIFQSIFELIWNLIKKNKFKKRLHKMPRVKDLRSKDC